MNIVKKVIFMIPWNVFWVHFLLLSLQGKILVFYHVVCTLFIDFIISFKILILCLEKFMERMSSFSHQLFVSNCHSDEELKEQFQLLNFQQLRRHFDIKVIVYFYFNRWLFLCRKISSWNDASLAMPYNPKINIYLILEYWLLLKFSAEVLRTDTLDSSENELRC